MTHTSLTQVKPKMTASAMKKMFPELMGKPGSMPYQLPEVIDLQKSPNSLSANSANQLTFSSNRSFISLMDLEQAQSLTIGANLEEGNVKRIYGQIDKVSWKELRIVLDAIISTILEAELGVGDDLDTQAYVVFVDNKWRPGLQLLGKKDVFSSPAVLDQIDTIVKAVLLGLTRSADNKTDDMFGPQLPQKIDDSIQHCVKESLNTFGGKKIVQPISVVTATCEQTIANQFGDKACHEDFHPVRIELEGVFVGFDVDIGELIFRTDGKKVRIAYAKDKIDLFAVTRAIVDKTVLVVTPNRTIHRNGQDIYSQSPTEKLFTLP